MATPPPVFSTPTDELRKEFETSKREVADLRLEWHNSQELFFQFRPTSTIFFNSLSHPHQINILSQVTQGGLYGWTSLPLMALTQRVAFLEHNSSKVSMAFLKTKWWIWQQLTFLEMLFHGTSRWRELWEGPLEVHSPELCALVLVCQKMMTWKAH